MNPILYSIVKEIPIIWEDDFCVVVNKPNNLLVHHSHYSRNVEEASLLQLLQNQGFDFLIPVHRLDRKTSGLLILAKKNEFVKKFQELFGNGLIQKKYHALVRGYVAEGGEINSPVKNERGNYKEALTHFTCIRQIELDIPVFPYETARYSFVEFTPITGRRHQLRIHACKINHPIVGDHKYGSRHQNQLFAEKLNLPNLFLHANELIFEHPITKKTHNFSAEKEDFWNIFDEIVKIHQG
jgi:tRNA pseudouridine65 synthase